MLTKTFARDISATATLVILFLVQCSAPEEISGAIPTGDKHLHNQKDSKTNSERNDPESIEDSVLHLLLAALSPFKVAAEKTFPHDDGLPKPVPAVELEKLKTSAQSAGLSEQKSNRVRRAVELLNLGYNDIATLRQAYHAPETSADYGDWMRMALEKRCIGEEVRRNVPADGSPALNPGDAYQRLRTAAKLSGLKDKEIDAFAKVVASSKLEQEQLTKLEEAIVQHGPGPVDMKKLTEEMAALRKAKNG